MLYICGVKEAKVTYQELRLGNIVHYKNRVKFHTLRVSYLDEKKIKLGGYLRRYDQIIPVPLTKEILVDWCGFTFDATNNTYNKSRLKLRHNPETNSVLIRLCGKVRELISLHQLQNLYFAITGEEINIPEEVIDPWITTYYYEMRRNPSDEYIRKQHEKLRKLEAMAEANRKPIINKYWGVIEPKY